MDVPPVTPDIHRSQAVVSPGPPLASAITHLHLVREVCPPESVYENPPLTFLGMFLTERGEADATMGGRLLRHQPGGLMLLTPGMALVERVGRRSPWKVGYMLLSGPWPDALAALLDERGRGGTVYLPAPAHWQRQFTDLLNLGFGQGEGWQWPFLSGCAALFGWVARYPASEGGADRLLDDVERLLETAPERAWSLDELAGALGMTARQFGYRFSKVTGCAPALWLRQRRIAAARRLLSEGRSVSETADALGFANPYHFSRMFKSVTGSSPSSLRVQRGPGRLHQEQP